MATRPTTAHGAARDDGKRLRIGLAVGAAAFEEFVEIWQRLFTHFSRTLYFRRACIICRRFR
jgi:hypothetical protein